ncbi:hypothetical protein SAMN05216410_2681 [Sanguibacter gelidistatuariae]|uniref:Uncharacterized protein n=2 Tax=Sanguibacter gelidistatuariae TaxID=1814289 RepID=A0A1G6RGP0_9MICO|nr:hypothetical protein SAMN05216410_2681 [Sanguibacter gelidistatuariae]
MTVVNIAVASTVLAAGLGLPEGLVLRIGAAAIVAFALTSSLALARRQGIGRDDARLTALQRTLFVATWAGILLWSVASAWDAAATWALPISLDPSGPPPRDEGPIWTLSTVGQTVAAAGWLVLMVHLSARLRGHRLGRSRASAEARPPWHRRWPDLVFTLMVPGNLAMLAWVVSGGGLIADSGDLGTVFAVIMATPVLFALLFFSTIQAVDAVPRVHGLLFTPAQAWLQIGLWASLGAWGAGSTMTDIYGEEVSAFLTLFPGTVDASDAVGWIGLVGSVVLYTLLQISLRRRRLISVHERRAAARRLNQARAGRS